MESATWHYPPDFLSMMTDTIPLLVRSKADLLAFFKGAGVPEPTLRPMRERLSIDRNSLKMYDITRHVLYTVNEMKGDAALAVRREIVRRVTQFTAFERCYPDKALQARGAVQSIRDFVRDRDTLTRLHEERECERARSAEKVEHERREIAIRREQRQDIAKRLAALFSRTDAVQRGRHLEEIINDLFRLDGVLVRDSLSIVSQAGSGIVEQIDGIIELDGHSYLVEMKWWSTPLGVDEVSRHMTRAFSRAQSRGIYIVHPGYTSGAVEMVRDSLRLAPFVLCTMEEVVMILEADVRVPDWLRPKIRAAMYDRQPFAPFERS